MQSVASATFERLLNEGASEEELHSFIARHAFCIPQALDAVINASCIYSKVRLGSEYVVDFAIPYPTTSGIWWRLVEIERPDQKLFTSAGDPSAQLTHAIRQVQSWKSWVRQNYAYASQILPGLVTCFTVVVIGRRASLATRDRDLLAQLSMDLRHFEVMTYDRLLDTMRGVEHLKITRVFPTARTHADLCADREQIAARTHVASLESTPVQSRVSANARGSCWFRSWIGSRPCCGVTEDGVCHYPESAASGCPLYPDDLKKELL